MKTTLEIPDALFRRAKAAAAHRGIPFRALVSEALTDKLRANDALGKPWMKGFGKLRSLHSETLKINKIIEDSYFPCIIFNQVTNEVRSNKSGSSSN